MEIQTHPHCPYIYLDINAAKEKKVNVNTISQEQDVVDAMYYNNNETLDFIQKP